MKPTSFDAIWPLTPLQEGMLFHALYDGGQEGVDHYNMQLPIELTGPLDRAALRRACEQVLARHPALRVGFLQRRSGEPFQAVASQVELPWAEVDLTGHDPAEQQARLRRTLTEERHRRFETTRPPLLRFTLVALAADRHVLALTNHHILLDGWSMPVVVEDLFRILHHGDAAALDPAVSVGDYLGWLGARNRGATEAAWGKALAGLEGPTLLGRGADPAGGGVAQRRIRLELDERRSRALAGAARDRNLTVNTVVQGSWSLLLSLLTGSEDVVFGCTVADRPAAVPGVDRIVGLLINTVPARVRIDRAEPFGALLDRIQDEQAGLAEHSWLGLADIHRISGHDTLFDTTVAFENFPLPASARGVDVAGLRLALAGEAVEEVPEGTHYPLSLAVFPGPTTVFELNYRADLYPEERARALLDRLGLLVGHAVERPDTPVGRLPLLTEEERVRIDRAAAPAPVATPPGTLVDLFEAQAARTPDAPAVGCGDERLTFAELNTAANRLARRLVARGAAPERPVVMALPRTAGAVVTLLAILKSGAVYAPVDLEQPAERIAAVFTDLRPHLVVTTGAAAARLPEGTERLLLDELPPSGNGTDLAGTDLTDADRLAPLRPENLAYTVYTSGSTGRPKGVAVEHRSLANMFHSHRVHLFEPEQAAAGRPLRAALTNSLVFDASWSQLLWMVGGHELHMIEEELRADPHALLDHVTRHGIEVLDTTPSFARRLVDEGLLGPDRTVRVLALGGEAVDEALWQRLRAVEGLSGYNLYGPAECTVDPMYARLAAHRHPVIGGPADNLRAHLLDDALRPVPPGVTGELYLAGAGLARGYLGRRALTAERFVADPFGGPGTRMYRTGDRAQRDDDGTLVFLGRTDDQIKIRGFRVEPGEIEAVLAADPGVRHAVAVAREDHPGSPVLVAYVVAAPGAAPDGEALRARAAAVLPGYMVPTAVVVLDELPTTVNGKVDKAALPAPRFEGGAGGEPRDEREELLHGLFAEVLRVERVGIHDNFFNLGGDSLLSMRLSALARRAGLALSPRDVFLHRTVAALAAASAPAATSGDTGSGGTGSGDATAEQPTEGPLLDLTAEERAELGAAHPDAVEVWPLTALQQGMSFHALLAPDRVDPYITQQVFDLDGEVAPAALRAAFAAVLARHANLRARFVRLRSGRAVQVIPERVELPWQEADLSGLAAEEQARRVEELVAGEHDRPFPLGTSPLLRALLVRLADHRHVLVVTDHHILLDGWSVPLFYREVFTAYAAGGSAEGLPEPVPFRRVLAWLTGRDGAAAERAWSGALAGLDEPTLVAPHADLSVLAAQGTAHAVLDAGASARITAAARAAGITVNTLLNGAWAIALERLTGRADVVFGASVSGRAPELPGIEDAIGLVMNTVPFRAVLDPAEPLADALLRLQTEQSELIAHHHLGLPAIQRAAGLGELFDTIVGFENAGTDHAGTGRTGTDHAGTDHAGTGRTEARRPVPGLGIGLREPSVPGSAHYPLRLLVRPGERLDVKLHYRTDLYDEAEADDLLASVLRVLETFAEAPRTPLAALDPLSAATRETVLERWAATAPAAPAATIPALFAERVAEHPGAPAVLTGTEELSYAELDARANRSARVLLAHGAGPERTVAVLMPRTAELVTTILAIWKSGSVHMPVDTDYPADRIGFMLTEARPDLVLAAPDAVGKVPAGLRDRVVTTDLLTAPADTPSGEVTDAERGRPLLPGCGAYIIFTSGSTGRPKGVLVTHTGLASFLATQRRHLDLGPGRKVLWFASPSFDGAMGELNTALLSGSCVVVGSYEEMLPGQPLADWVARTGVGTLTVPPSSLAAMADGSLPEGITVVTGGEVLPPELVARWAPGRRMLNIYGPTETTIIATVGGPLEPGVAVSIGVPVVGARIRVLDHCLRPLPAGVPGEVYISGAGLARGYLHRPDLTASRYVADPFGEPGTRMYRTGDLARWLPDGRLDYVRRADDQVKLRGFRIEPGEVEAVLAADPAVRHATVQLREDTPGSRQLVAYVVPAGPDGTDPAALRERVAAHLPEYMVPAAVVEIPELPTTPHGKLDRAALPAPRFAAAEGSRAPRTPREELLLRLFVDVLRVERIGIDDSFFALGGDSIMSIKLVTAAREAGLEISPRDVFTHKSIAELAAAVTESAPEGAAEEAEEPLIALEQDELDEFISRFAEED
ncbi:amino acid adenylation domain-containing protein [Kitasatospora sp. NPDC056446]|uniref:amino acid adenylation domain-containing protein n=1 Tax=Kitasatospora sp. NPDC056446 TaxID=3345819 RepID=UPI0036B77B51